MVGRVGTDEDVVLDGDGEDGSRGAVDGAGDAKSGWGSGRQPGTGMALVRAEGVTDAGGTRAEWRRRRDVTSEFHLPLLPPPLPYRSVRP